jgi:hypothetical protein
MSAKIAASEPHVARIDFVARRRVVRVRKGRDPVVSLGEVLRDMAMVVAFCLGVGLLIQFLVNVLLG